MTVVNNEYNNSFTRGGVRGDSERGRGKQRDRKYNHTAIYIHIYGYKTMLLIMFTQFGFNVFSSIRDVTHPSGTNASIGDEPVTFER